MWRFKDEACETGEEYEKELVALKKSLADSLGSPENFPGIESIEKIAAHILGQRSRFPDVFERHRDIEPMLGDIMSRRVQSDFFKGFAKPGEE
jgi:hypothetical protein